MAKFLRFLKDRSNAAPSPDWPESNISYLGIAFLGMNAHNHYGLKIKIPIKNLTPYSMLEGMESCLSR